MAKFIRSNSRLPLTTPAIHITVFRTDNIWSSPKKNMTKRHSNKTYWIGLMLVLAFTFVQSLDLYKDIKATNWPTVAGQIHWQTHSSGPFRNERYGNIIGSLHWKEVQFSYMVDGFKYSLSNISFGFTFSDEFELANPLDSEHSAVKIYFNPYNQSEAVLIQDQRQSIFAS
ncbi:MAG: hypothetical protein WA946_10095 [Nitrospirota bacterium]